MRGQGVIAMFYGKKILRSVCSNLCQADSRSGSQKNADILSQKNLGTQVEVRCVARVQRLLGTFFERFAWGALIEGERHHENERGRHAWLVQITGFGNFVYLGCFFLFANMFSESLRKKFLVPTQELAGEFMTQMRSMKMALE